METKCLRNVNELRILLNSLRRNNKDYEKIDLEKIRNKFGYETMKIYEMLSDYEDLNRETEKYFRRFGENRLEAIKNLVSHFREGCKQCTDLYTDLLSMETFGVMFRKKINIKELEKIYGIMEEIHRDYLGNEIFNGGIKLEDFFV